jgi:hypothetical protein
MLTKHVNPAEMEKVTESKSKEGSTRGWQGQSQSLQKEGADCGLESQL